MKNGRINERNIGSVKLDGGIKRSKLQPVTILSDIEEEAYNSLILCNMILNKGIKIYDTTPELVKQWIRNGIAEIKEFKNTNEVTKKFFPIEKRAILIESKRSDIELCKNLIIEFYPIINE
jgi:hypothetical protein